MKDPFPVYLNCQMNIKQTDCCCTTPPTSVNDVTWHTLQWRSIQNWVDLIYFTLIIINKYITDILQSKIGGDHENSSVELVSLHGPNYCMKNAIYKYMYKSLYTKDEMYS